MSISFGGEYAYVVAIVIPRPPYEESLNLKESHRKTDWKISHFGVITQFQAFNSISVIFQKLLQWCKIFLGEK